MPVMFGDRKKIASVISGKSGALLKPEQETDDGMKVLQALAQDAIDAMHSGSASDLARAFKAFIVQCGQYSEEG